MKIKCFKFKTLVVLILHFVMYARPGLSSLYTFSYLWILFTIHLLPFKNKYFNCYLGFFFVMVLNIFEWKSNLSVIINASFLNKLKASLCVNLKHLLISSKFVVLESRIVRLPFAKLASNKNDHSTFDESDNKILEFSALSWINYFIFGIVVIKANRIFPVTIIRVSTFQM